MRDTDKIDQRTTQVVKRRKVTPRSLNDAFARWDPYCVTYAPDEFSSNPDENPLHLGSVDHDADEEDDSEEVSVRAGLKRKTVGASRGYIVR